MVPDKNKLERELTFKTSRSGGKGGQNVNKVSSKVELLFDVLNSEVLNSVQKNVLFSRLSTRISADGVLHVTSQESRSQRENREKALEKFFSLLEKAFTPQKKRISTKPGKNVKEKRLKEKKLRSERKKERRLKL